MADLQGQEANKKGKEAEIEVANIIKKYSQDCAIVNYKDYVNNFYTNDTVIIKNKPYETYLWKKGRGDLFVESRLINKPFAIEVRSQNVQGSVTDKAAGLFRNVLRLGVDTAIIALLGRYIDPGMLRFLKEEAAATTSVNVKVFNIFECDAYIKNTFESGIVC